jgi:hypothetical protein
MARAYFGNTWHASNSLSLINGKARIEAWNHLPDPVPQPTANETPALLEILKGAYYIHIYPVPYSNELPPPHTWPNILHTLPSWGRQLLSPVCILDIDQLINILTQPHTSAIIVASDGSFKEPHGAFAWILQHNNSTIANASGPVSGNPITALRSECFGVLSWLFTLLTICDHFHIDRISATIIPYTDNTTTTQYMTNNPIADKYVNLLLADYDVRKTIHDWYAQLHQKCPLLQHGIHVKAQNNDPSQSIQTRLHTECDTMAKSCRKEQIVLPTVGKKLQERTNCAPNC